MKKITSLAICLFACSSLTATAQSKFFPERQRLTPDQVKEGVPFVLCNTSLSDSEKFYDKERHDFVDGLSVSSKLQAEKNGSTGKYYIKHIQSGQYLGYNGKEVTWNEKSQAKTFNIEAVSISPEEGSGAARYPLAIGSSSYDLVSGAWGRENKELLIRLRDGNKIFNCVGYGGRAEFRGGNQGWTVFAPYAPVDITLSSAEREPVNKLSFKGYIVDESDYPAGEGKIGYLLNPNGMVSEENKSFTFDIYNNPKAPEGNKIYYIKGESRGYLYYESTAAVGSKGLKFVWATSKSNKSFDKNDNAFKWYVIEKGDKKYFYNLGVKKFAVPLAQTYSGGAYDKTWVFTSVPAPISFEDISGKDRYSKITSNNTALSISVGYDGPCISYDVAGDGGLPFTFIEAKETSIPAEADAMFEKLNLTFNDGGDGYQYATFYGDSHVALPENAGVEVYIATGNNAENKITLQKKETNVLPAGQGVLLRKQTATPLQLEVSYDHSQVQSFDGNLFVGTVEENVPSNGSYVLNKKEGQGIGFYQLAASVTSLPPYKATLPASAVGTGGAPVLFDWTVTGLNGLSVEGNKAGAIYDLLGRPAAKATKGLYIVNGKKVLF